MNNVREEGLEHSDRYYGSYRGFVEDNDDKENLGRLKVKVPSIYGDEVYDYWALPKGIYAGKGVGSFWIPAKGDNVWISFEGGDVRFPIWEYGWWSEQQVPENADKDIKVLQTNSGNRIEMNDTDESITVRNKDGKSVVITKDLVILGNIDADKEKAVLGDTLHDLLNEFTDDVGNLMTIKTSNGVTASINTATNWNMFKNKWTTKWEDFKSQVVKLD